MKPNNFLLKPLLLCAIIVGAAVMLVSWDFKQLPGRYQQSQNDTVPKLKKSNTDKKVRDLDEAIDELNAIDLKIEMEKAQKEVTEAMKNMDAEKIKMEVEKAMKEIDMEKIKKEVDESVAKIDMKKIKAEVDNAMKEIDAVKIQHEVEASIAKIDWEKMKNQLDEVKNMNLDKINVQMKEVEENLKKIGPQIAKEMENAKVQIEKAKVEMKEYKDFVDELNNDGLINKKEEYSIKHKNGELLINGKKASDEVYSKYRSFLEKHQKFNIEKSNDDFNIDID